ncbi:MAG: DNA mismatch repair protein MutT [Dinoroseobacter sp.]|uniref:NUDIX hydrolase n=1 Tax=Alterinioella nitratireducens TaxID=2735915 RepID=UPI000C4FA039|nr:NUDIX hydrolase [Alterinioella nitratireducens]MAN13702.1 DNA mismatch repair protein MutT [Dinoroseobacter sp.]MAX73940.1 DNA mismatch repair protein MutT [Nioella sp.]NPD17992.1 NUDIX hydrolase [Alterinioella nitratireducens]
MGQEDARILDKSAIRNAATIIMLRDAGTRPRVLMGQRGKAAAFMPSKFVFPGGAVDAVDARIPLACAPTPDCATRLANQSDLPAAALLAAATRELWEETGLLLGAPDPRAETIAAPQGWRGYLATGHLPDGDALRFVFRAITPPGRPRRFDARFFMADAERLANDPDDFSSAEDELSHLQWVPLDEARGFDMPFITEVVLAEIGAILKGEAQPGVPFFNNTGEISRFERL